MAGMITPGLRRMQKLGGAFACALFQHGVDSSSGGIWELCASVERTGYWVAAGVGRGGGSGGG